jgi:hypothetical protein
MKKLVLSAALVVALVTHALAAPQDGKYVVVFSGTCPITMQFIVSQGRLSGTLTGLNGTQAIEGLALAPDGGFTGRTTGAGASSKASLWTISGHFSGSSVSVTTIGTGVCGTSITAQGQRSGN